MIDLFASLQFYMKTQVWIILGCLAAVAICNSISFQSTMPSFEVNLKSVSLTSPASSSPTNQQNNVTVTFLNTYTAAPSIALAIRSMSYTPPSGTSASIYFQLYSDTANQTSFTFIFYRTKLIFTSLEISYFACSNCGVSSSFEIIQKLISPNTIKVAGAARNESFTIPYLVKSNVNHSVVRVWTTQGDFSWSSGAFDYSLSTSTYTFNDFQLTISVGVNCAISSITLSIVTFEQSVFIVNTIYFLDYLNSSAVSGQLPNSASTYTDSDMSTVFYGFNSLKFTDTGSVQYSVSLLLSGTNWSFTVTQLGITASNTEYLWYRMRTCGTNYYIDISAPPASCVSCHYSCLTCANSSNIGCLTCLSPTRSRLVSDSSCPCITGYFDVASQYQCSICTNNCLTCLVASINCTTCNPTLYRELITVSGSSSCDCSTGYYHNGSAMCQACKYSCHTCSLATDNCTTCSASYHRTKNQALSTCPCDEGYYDQGNSLPTCLACHYSCLSCTGSGACDACDTNNKFRNQTTLGTGYCLCLSGYYDDLINALCQKCYYKCKTCSQYNLCGSCDSTRTINSTGMCVCNSGYYDTVDVEVCQPCQYSCLSCSNSSACSTCDYSKSRTFDVSQGSYCVCAAKTFDQNDMTNNTCVSCDTTCANCTGTSDVDCTACNSSAFRVLNVSSCQCIDGYFSAIAQELCTACSYKCLTCSSSSVCLTCDANELRDTPTANCTCMAGYFENNTATCATCPYYCLTCTNSTACVTCDATTRTMPSCACKSGYYNDLISKVCPSCMITCLTCNAASTCLTCKSTNFRTINVQKSCVCMSKTYEANPIAAACLACNYSCLSCSNSTGTDCITCNSTAQRGISSTSCPCNIGYFDNGVQLCKACQYTCETCLSLTSCQTCSATLKRTKSGSFCICLDGYYDNNISQACIACHYSCKTCTNGSECLACDTVMNRTANTTTKLCSCVANTYDDGVHAQCVGCTSKCLTCTSTSSCATCNTSDHRYLLSGSCFCSAGYYDDGGSTCPACDYSCQTCTAAAACTSCDVSKFRELTTLCTCMQGYYNIPGQMQCGTCLVECLTCTAGTTCDTCSPTNHRTYGSTRCPCNSGYFESNQAACTACTYYCNTCTNTSVCVDCNPAHQRTLNSLTKQCDCNTGFYNSGTTALCLNCSYTCQTCTNGTNCSSCLSTSKRTFIGGQCVCPNTYYDDLLSINCASCNYKCLTCTNSLNCTSCDSTKYRTYSSATQACNCNTKYYDDGTSTLCVACHYTCATCLNGLSCATCSTTNKRQLNSTSGYCACMVGYYDDLTNALCKACHYSCLTCTNNSACTSCTATKNRNTVMTANLCLCLTGFYDDGSSAACKSCLYHCLTCTNSTACVTCSTGATNYRVLTAANQCSCQDGYFDTQVSSMQCSACSYKCTTCSKSATNCTTCNATNFRTYLGGTCVCNQRYYDDLSNNLCASCLYHCSTCTNGTTCQTCNATKFRTMSATLCACMTGYYDTATNSQTCQKCDYSCGTCTAAGSCSTCSSTSHRTIDASNQCICDQHYFDNNFLTCSACLYSCSTCDSATACLTCDTVTNNRQMNASTSQCVCKEFYFDDGTNQLCLGCSYSCASCTNSSACLACDSSLHRTLLTSPGLCTCTGAFYDSGSGVALCAPCNYSCATCNISSQCASCNGANFRTLNTLTKQCDCIAGYYDDGTNQLCLPCAYTCQTCTDANTCSGCTALKLRTLSSNQCLCNQYYFDDLSFMLCQACNYSCSSCTNATACFSCNITNKRIPSGSTCVCDSGYYDDGINEMCKLCPYYCVTCTSATTCSSCNSTNFRLTGLSCLCAAQYFDDGTNSSVCKSCNYMCATCSGLTDCLTCNSNRYRLKSSSTCICMDKYYDNGASTQLCQPCLYQCATCTNNTACTTCNSTLLRTLSGTTCACNQHYYDDLTNQLCASCLYKCSSCSDGTTCDTCNATKFRTLNLTINTCDCMVGYFDNQTSNEICRLCNPSCKTCLSDASCATCEPLNFRVLNATTMTYCDCFWRYYNVNSSICAACHYSCRTCSNGTANDCLSCHTNLNRLLTGTKCPCTGSFYDDGINEQCQPCEFKCTKCTGPTANNCTACDTTFYLLSAQTTCYVNCPSYYWNDSSSMACTSCPSNCLSCSISTLCTLCQTGYYLFGYQPVNCTTTCPTGYYADLADNTCKLCLANCTTCTGLYNCSTCLASNYLDVFDALCYNCHSTCKNCTGPGADQCTYCQYPLYLKSSICTNLTCSPKYYVDPILGCTHCSSLFSNSLTCNISTILTCSPTYVLSSNTCKSCSSVTGFYLDNNNNCRQICGDGKLYVLQCDDGNNLDGDGCSSSCNLEEGWNCSNTNSQTSTSCVLAVNVVLELYKMEKVQGKNEARFSVRLNVPIRLTVKNFNVSIPGVNTTLSVNAINLTHYQLIIGYTATIQKSKMAIRMSLSSSRRLLLVTSTYVDLEFDFTVSTYPPSNFYPQDIQAMFNAFSKAIKGLSLATLAFCLFCYIGVRRTVYYSVEAANLLVILYVSQGYGLDGYIDWLAYSIINLKQSALIGGFSLGDCGCPAESFHSTFGYQDQFTQNGGILLSIYLVLTVIYCILFLILKCYKLKHATIQKQHSCYLQLKKWQYYLKYFLFASVLGFSGNLIFSALIALYGAQLTSTASAINIFLAVLVIVGYLTFLVMYFSWSRNLRIGYVHPDDVKSKDATDQSVKQPVSSERRKEIGRLEEQQGSQNIVMEKPLEEKSSDSKSDQAATEPQNKTEPEKIKYTDMIIYDFKDLFRDSRYSKYYTSLVSVLILFQLMCVSLMHQVRMGQYLCMIALNIACLLFIFIVKPFVSRLNNLRSILICLLMTLLYVVDIVLIGTKTYIYELEVTAVAFVCGILTINLILLLCQFVNSYSVEIDEWAKPYLMRWKMSRKQRARQQSPTRDLAIEQFHVAVQPVGDEQQKEQQPQRHDAFFERVLKKNRINRQYRRARMMKQIK